MKTTTTTARIVRRDIDRAALMAAAHRRTRATVAEYPGADYRATFAAALRLAWEDATAPAAVDAWAAMTGEEQVKALTASALNAARKDYARTDSAGNDRADRFAWARIRTAGGRDDVLAPDALSSIVGLAWEIMTGGIVDDATGAVKVEAYLTNPRHADKPLAVLMAQAVRTAAQKIDRYEKRHARAVRFADIPAPASDSSKADGGDNAAQRVMEIVLNAAPMAERFTAPDTAAALRDAVESVCMDDTDRRIMAGLIDGYTARDIARRIGISHTAINKRVDKMRRRYASGDTYADGYGMAYAPAN